MSPARRPFWARLILRVGRMPGIRRAALHPVVARPGYWCATAAGLCWAGLVARGPIRRHGSLVVAAGCPRWAFGRGGTTIGAVYLTDRQISAPVLRHEAVHQQQWRRYGLAFIALYAAAGSRAHTNRFEREAGLADGGYGGYGGYRG